jgi:putative endonuclease
MWHVYLVRCNDGSLYAGSTTDPFRREKEHNGELRGGAAYTAARRPVTLVWHTPVGGRADSMRAEYTVKKLSVATKHGLTVGTRLLRKEERDGQTVFEVALAEPTEAS